METTALPCLYEVLGGVAEEEVDDSVAVIFVREGSL